MRMKVTVSWITPLLVTGYGVTVTRQSQNGSPWSGDMNSLLKKKFKRQLSVGKVMCTVFWDRKEVILLVSLKPRQTINSDHCVMMLTKLKAQTSRVRPEKNTTLLLQHDSAGTYVSLKTVENIANLGFTVLSHPPHIWI